MFYCCKGCADCCKSIGDCCDSVCNGCCECLEDCCKGIYDCMAKTFSTPFSFCALISSIFTFIPTILMVIAVS